MQMTRGHICCGLKTREFVHAGLEDIFVVALIQIVIGGDILFNET